MTPRGTPSVTCSNLQGTPALAQRSLSSTTGCLTLRERMGLRSCSYTRHMSRRERSQSRSTAPAMASTRSASTFGGGPSRLG
eukprot:1187894-Prorocentrum_minimum.AAC.2